jgi:hypothetical protein
MKFARKDKRSNIQKEIDSVFETLEYLEPNSDSYTTIVKNVKTLYEAKALEKEEKKFKVSPDTIVVGVLSLVEVILMLNYEKAGTITSKVLSRIPKWRV